MGGIDFRFLQGREVDSSVVQVDQIHGSAPQFQGQNGLGAEDADFVVTSCRRCDTRAGNTRQRSVVHLHAQGVVDVEDRAIVIEAGKDLRGPGAAEVGKVSRGVRDLAIALAAARHGRIAVRAGLWADVRLLVVVRDLGIDAAEQLVDRVGHQHADHLDPPQSPRANVSLRLPGMPRVVPRTTDHKLQTLPIRKLHEFAGLGDGDGHGLFQQHVQAAVQRGFGLCIVNIRRAGNDHRLENRVGQHVIHVGKSVGGAEIACDPLRVGQRSRLHGAECRPRMALDRRHVGIRPPPAGADHSHLDCHGPPRSWATGECHENFTGRR